MVKRSLQLVAMAAFSLAAAGCGDSASEPVTPTDGDFSGSVVSFTVSGNQLTDIELHLSCTDGGTTTEIDGGFSMDVPITAGRFTFSHTAGDFSVSGSFDSNDLAQGIYHFETCDDVWSATRK